MAIYEPEDFWKANDEECAKRDKAADKLKRMRVKQARDESLKDLDGTPTALDLEQAFLAHACDTCQDTGYRIMPHLEGQTPRSVPCYCKGNAA